MSAASTTTIATTAAAVSTNTTNTAPIYRAFTAGNFTSLSTCSSTVFNY